MGSVVPFRRNKNASPGEAEVTIRIDADGNYSIAHEGCTCEDTRERLTEAIRAMQLQLISMAQQK